MREFERRMGHGNVEKKILRFFSRGGFDRRSGRKKLSLGS
jgi:hypothetical protein